MVLVASGQVDQQLRREQEMIGADPEDVVRRYFDALSTGDHEVIRDSWAEDGSCWYGGDLPISGTWNGRDQVIKGYADTQHWERALVAR